MTSNGATGQGGAAFNDAAVQAPAASTEALFELCWPADAAPTQRVQLVTLETGDVRFEALEGASNSTARCIREIATTVPGKRQVGGQSIAPPSKRPSGWVALAYVKLLSASRFGPERGVLDPAPLVAACLSKGDAPRPGVQFVVSMEPELKVKLESNDGFSQPTLTDSERCIEAVLGSTVWPNTRGFTLDFSGADKTAPAGDVAHYFAIAGAAAQAIDPGKVKEAISTSGPAVAACWDAALVRRAGLAGGRSVRLRVDEAGAVTNVAVLGNVSAEATTAADYLLDLCLSQGTKKARFPAGSAGDAVYSWVFAERR